jgi:hypothetical protein
VAISRHFTLSADYAHFSPAILKQTTPGEDVDYFPLGSLSGFRHQLSIQTCLPFVGI